MKTQKLGPFLGANNRLPDTEMRVSTKQVSGNYLRESANVDIDNAGNLRRRESELLIQAMTGAHSLHMVSATAGYLVRDSVLYAVTLPSYAETFAKTLSSNDTMSWLTVGDDLYFSNGTDAGRITEGLFFPIGLPTPDAPTCITVGGGLLEGNYLVAVAYYHSVTGEEGGISARRKIAVGAASGLRITMPAATTGATHVNVYVSEVNGSVPMLAGTYATGTATVDFTTPPTQWRPSHGRDELPLPAGTLFMSNGKLCSFADKTVHIGLPFRPGYYLPAGGYLLFAEPVSIAIENQGGTYIAADKTYWFPGDIEAEQGVIATVLPYGAVPGTAFRNPADTTVGWFGDDGFVIGSTSGEVKAAMSDHIDLTAPDTGCSIVRVSNGYLRVIGGGWCFNLERNAATQYTGFDFTSLSGDYGTKAGGVYALSGGAGVEAWANVGKQNFGSEELKHMPAMYLGFDSESPMQLRIQTPEHDYTYDSRSCSGGTRMHRVDPGKGLRATWFDLTLYNTDGAAFTLATASPAPVASGRRI